MKNNSLLHCYIVTLLKKKLFSNGAMEQWSNGFTLIELLVVVGILGILTVTLLATFNPLAQFQKANDGRRKSDLAQIQRALETYYQDHNRYPTNSPSTDPNPFRIEDPTNPNYQNDPLRNWGDPWQPYINVLPSDPGGKTYVYYSPDGQTYYLYASLDRGSLDPQACNNGNVCTNVPVSSGAKVLCGTDSSDVCNYGVSSPNASQ